jgi:hypothetical protein
VGPHETSGAPISWPAAQPSAASEEANEPKHRVVRRVLWDRQG